MNDVELSGRLSSFMSVVILVLGFPQERLSEFPPHAYLIGGVPEFVQIRQQQTTLSKG